MAFNSSNLSSATTLVDIGRVAVDASDGMFGLMIVIGLFAVIFVSVKTRASVFTSLSSSLILTTLVSIGLYNFGWIQEGVIFTLIGLTALAVVINGLYPQ